MSAYILDTLLWIVWIVAAVLVSYGFLRAVTWNMMGRPHDNDEDNP